MWAVPALGVGMQVGFVTDHRQCHPTLTMGQSWGDWSFQWRGRCACHVSHICLRLSPAAGPSLGCGSPERWHVVHELPVAINPRYHLANHQSVSLRMLKTSVQDKHQKVNHVSCREVLQNILSQICLKSWCFIKCFITHHNFCLDNIFLECEYIWSNA